MEAFAIFTIGIFICFLLGWINDTLVEIVVALNYKNTLEYDKQKAEFLSNRFNRK